jgi:hypothetical protein
MWQFQLILIGCCSALSVAGFGLVPLSTRRTHHHGFQLRMVRNIDLPEAVVFYGADSLVNAATQEPLPGVEAMLKECQEINAAVLVLLYEEENHATARKLEAKYGLTIHMDAVHPPPNPRALYEAIESTLISPKGFGGSSGFGTKMADPERAPLPKHVVVLAHTDDQCRAARFFGARVMSLVDNDYADGIIFDWSEIGVDDISTPGSYWLNPPFGSKDDNGNKVDIYEVMDAYERTPSDSSSSSDDEVILATETLSEDALNAILNDMDSL